MVRRGYALAWKRQEQLRFLAFRKARETEKKEKRRKLFPIRLTDFETLRDWTCFDADTGKDLAVEVREYFAPICVHPTGEVFFWQPTLIPTLYFAPFAPSGGQHPQRRSSAALPLN
jgi:hypothetical protein